MSATSANNIDSTQPVSPPLPHCQDSLDSVLPTTLDGLDDGFCELAERRIAWWDSERFKSWLLNQGYFSYQRLYRKSGEASDTVFPSDARRQSTSFPYAYHEGPAENAWPPLSANTGERAIVGYAQDSQGRHVALKAVLFGSEEYRILKHLQDQGVPTSEDDFQNVIPILNILPCEGHWLVIMPRWGSFPLEPSYGNMKEVYHFIHCLLKGLSYLHSHRIVHGDIKMENILVNHVDRHYYDDRNVHRASLRIQGKLTYALFDFGHSTMFLESARIDECRLPSILSSRTDPSQRPDDTHQGEVDFDPFAFDVGMLGVFFCKEFQHLTALAPMLAPLFDMMTTRNISKRFTASAALTFFEEHVQSLTTGLEKILCCRRALNEYPVRYDEFNRWQDLDPHFIEKWARYREPPIPFHTLMLRTFCEHPWRWRLVYWVRYLAQYLTHLAPFCQRR